MRSPSTVGRFVAGDALRGLSALGVLSLHFVQFGLGGSGVVFTDVKDAMQSTYGAIGFLALFGGLWLSVFFVLSGYLISRPFVRAYVRDEPQPAFWRYARNRLLRIVPAFWVAVLATLVVFGPMGSSPWVVVLTLAFGQSLAVEEAFVTHIAQGWTLGTEMIFYLLVPALALWWGRRPSGSAQARAARIFALCLAAIVLTACWRTFGSEDPGWVWTFPGVAAFFAPGVVMAVAEATWPGKFASPRGRRLAGRLAAPLALLGLALFAVGVATPGPFTVWRLAIQLAGAGFIVAGPLLREWSGAPAWRLLCNRVTAWLGERSYSIYVFHYGVGLWFAQQLAASGHPWETLLRFGPLALLATLVISDLSWRFVERPFLRLKRRAKARPVGRSEAGAAAEPSLAGVDAQ